MDTERVSSPMNGHLDTSSTGIPTQHKETIHDTKATPSAGGRNPLTFRKWAKRLHSETQALCTYPVPWLIRQAHQNFCTDIRWPGRSPQAVRYGDDQMPLASTPEPSTNHERNTDD